jgi:hypothetical protein
MLSEVDLVIGGMAHNVLPPPRWCRRLGFNCPPRDRDEECIARTWQELFAREAVNAHELWQAVDDHAVPDLFLKKTKAFVHQYGHKACTRRFGDFK